MRLLFIECALSLGLYLILEMLLRDAVPVIARGSTTWQAFALPLLISVIVIALCELVTMGKARR